MTAKLKKPDWKELMSGPRYARRKRGDMTLRAIGLSALFVAIGILVLLVGSLTMSGYPAFTQTYLTLNFDISEKYVSREDPFKGRFRNVVNDAIEAEFPQVTNRAERRRLTSMPSAASQFLLRDYVVANPHVIGTTIPFSVPVSDPYDQLNKALIDRDTPEEFRRLKQDEIQWFDELKARGQISSKINWGLITNADSRFPEIAGLAGALTGSFYALMVCFLISFPVGIGAAIYLELFAPRNKFTDLIEININNLAAVPSVVFGLLALAVFLNWFGMPRSAPVVGGLTLALMTLPTIIIATRSAIKAVPPSIGEAAMGIGASRQQAVFHHILPSAMPGILTGTIIGLAQALGETAPLLLIGMNAFITAVPASPMDAATALPTQIFIWADSPERGFASRTSAAILVLLGFLVTMNMIAVYLRSKFEKTN
ncbi:phosphate ABC transporter permease PstA [Orrella marina]|uniref:Phosphate transport system permease protein PstA n=1 Tax=Orrella marina TaxID=2163011 RepID=A0A2R4XNM6_9BURK|nr:phosphate ABC transporter permease PstA [Orrella marina]AWB35407.1 phosphate ABC transporter permease PtsA [Orrella marina]